MEATQKPGWKKEAVEGVALETVFDKWSLLAQVCWQIVVADRPLKWKLQRTQDLLSHLTPKEKKVFNITTEDEEKLNNVLQSIRQYKYLLNHKNIFTNDFFLTRKTLSDEEKRNFLTKPERESYYSAVHWDKRSLTGEGEAKLIAETISNISLFGVQVKLEWVYCKLKYYEREPDTWKDEDYKDYKSYQFYGEDKIKQLDLGKDDPLIWRVSFYARADYLLTRVQTMYHERVLNARELIGSILQKMMKQFEGKKVYVIPEERKIP